MASVNDKLITAVPMWSGTIGTGGVADASTTTVPLASASGLTEGSIYVITIDRVDSAGAKTLSKREVVIGEVSGDNLINCLRGQEGTAQAHSAGAVVEVLFTAKQWNRLVEGFDAEHDADGTHMDSLPLTTPKITTSINDTNGNEVIKTPATSSAVNEITVTNAATNGSPSVTATGGDTNINLLASGKGTGLFIPQIPLAEGQMINGKLSVTVASNNLTVALKTNSGADPSAASPVYVMLGGTLRSVTSALTFTLNAGTNYFNSGSAELATKEVDYFVYAVYDGTNATTGIGIARIPYATVAADISNTATSEKYSPNTSNVNSAYYTAMAVIGRFAATLSAGAGYTWSVPTFTATNLIQRPIYETRLLTFTSTVTGYTGAVGGSYTYQIVNRQMRVYQNGSGTSNATTLTTTIPLSSVDTVGSVLSFCYGVDSGTAVAAPIATLGAPTRLDFYKTTALGAWTNSGTKTFGLYFTFEI